MESMGWFLLFLVLIAAALGVLGAVLKLAAALILAVVVFITILIAVGWFGFKQWVRDMERQAQAGPGSAAPAPGRRGGAYDVRGWVRREGSGTALPAPEDDPDQE